MSYLKNIRPAPGYVLAQLNPPRTHDEAGMELSVPEQSHWAKVISVGKLDLRSFFNPFSKSFAPLVGLIYMLTPDRFKIRPGEYIFVATPKVVVDEEDEVIIIKANEIRAVTPDPIHR